MSNVEKEYAWKVCVKCLTFNHAPYIEDALNGFCMQETDFPFVCAIIDDASTDGEQKVIKKYLEEYFDLEEKSVVRNEETEDYILTFARHKTNNNCYFAVLYLKYNHYSIKKDKMPYIAEWHENCKYIALCEGDDYWIDGKKLQKQVQIMQLNTKVTMVYSDAQTIDYLKNNVNMEKYAKYSKMGESGFLLKKLLLGNYIYTASICFRAEVIKSNIYNEAPVKLDYLYNLTAAYMGMIEYIDEKTCSYRIHCHGMMSTNRSEVVNATLEIKKYFYKIILRGTPTVINQDLILYQMFKESLYRLIKYRDKSFISLFLKYSTTTLRNIITTVPLKWTNRSLKSLK